MKIKIPTLEEVKEHFKNAKEVKGLWDIEFVGVNNIHFDNGSYFCQDN